MKKLIAVCLASLFIFSCSDQMTKLPDYWEYASGKWVSFKENIEIEWKYGGTKADKYKINKLKVVLTDDDIKQIIKLIRKEDIDGLVAKENALGTKTRWNEKISKYKSAAEMNFIDKIEPKPTNGQICFYQISAIKGHATSLPSEISVIFLDRSK